jgi:hypothetical protein
MKKSRLRTGPRHVRIYHRMSQTPAWKSLNGNERATYLLLAERYMGLNNGRIFYSVREVVSELRISQPTACRCLQTLVERGFIVARVKGAFSLKRRHATEWRLTEHTCNVSGHGPSHEYRDWRPFLNLEHGFPGETDGFPGETGVAKIARNGFRGETVKAKKRPPRFHQETTLSYQVPPADEGKGKLPWSTPTVVEVTDPVEAALIRQQCEAREFLRAVARSAAAKQRRAAAGRES